MNNALFTYVLRLADDSLILSQRLSAWCYNAPFLEEDIALTNIALDYLGRANSLYEYASSLDKKKRTPDELAFRRDESDFYNCLLVEQPNGHFGDTIARQFLIDSFYITYFSFLMESNDKNLSAIAKKSIKEAAYHFRHSSKWVVRLGDGTKESHQKITKSFEMIWKYVNEMFEQDSINKELLEQGIGVSLDKVQNEWENTVKKIFNEARIEINTNCKMIFGGRKGHHTNEFKALLEEMQHLQRTYPDATW